MIAGLRNLPGHMPRVAAIEAAAARHDPFCEPSLPSGETRDDAVMIVTCPECKMRYSVDGKALGGGAGRRVRCASCGHVWRCPPEAAPVIESVDALAADGNTAPAEPQPMATALLPALLDDEWRAPAHPEPRHNEAQREEPRPREQQADGLRAEPRLDMPQPAAATIPPLRAFETPAPAATRRRRARLGVLGLAIVAVLVLLTAIGFREHITELWPSTASLYRNVGIADSISAGLEVTVKPERLADSLVVDGKIVNTAAAERHIPALRVALRDGNNVEVDAQVVRPPVESLAPGASANFRTTFKHPSTTATGVAVSFASR